MAVTVPNGSVDTIKITNKGIPVRKWIRDSWARRKIVALQQAIATIVVPTKTSQLTNDSGFITQADVPPGSTASSTAPKMDGTASVGTETAFARGDHRHPTDTSRQAALSSAQMAAVNSGITSAKVAAYDAIEVPTKTSELTNDSGFITISDVPTKTSELTNDSGFITSYTETDPTVPAWAKASTKPSYTAAEVGALPDDTVIPTVPTKVSAFQNDAGYITGFTETDPTVPAWAKASTKPTYTASEIGALPDTTEIPSKTSDLTNDSGYITSSDLPSVPSPSTANPKMDGTASAGSSSAWSRGDHVHPHDTSKADKATTLAGYGITNAYTKTEVDGMIPTVPTNVSAFTNDAGYITSAPVTSVNGQTGAVNLSASDVGAQDALSTAQLAAVNSGITADHLAVNDSSVLCTVTPIEPTLSAGANYATYGGCWYYKIGCRVTVHIGVSGLTTGEDTTLWTLPAGYRPRSSIGWVGNAGGIGSYGRFRITSAGVVRAYSAAQYALGEISFDAFS